MKYQYHDLSEAQFEELAIAVCREILGIGVQGFSVGKDGGRDARFHGKAQAYKSQTHLWDGLIIIQAKHTNGFNEKFSDPSFFENQSSVIKKEISKIKTLFEANELDYYIIELKADLDKFLIFYNLNRRHGSLKRELKVRTPFEAVQCWYRIKPEIFKQSPGMFQADLLRNHGTT